MESDFSAWKSFLALFLWSRILAFSVTFYRIRIHRFASLVNKESPIQLIQHVNTFPHHIFWSPWWGAPCVDDDEGGAPFSSTIMSETTHTSFATSDDVRPKSSVSSRLFSPSLSPRFISLFTPPLKGSPSLPSPYGVEKPAKPIDFKFINSVNFLLSHPSP